MGLTVADNLLRRQNTDKILTVFFLWSPDLHFFVRVHLMIDCGVETNRLRGGGGWNSFGCLCALGPARKIRFGRTVVTSFRVGRRKKIFSNRCGLEDSPRRRRSPGRGGVTRKEKRKFLSRPDGSFFRHGNSRELLTETPFPTTPFATRESSVPLPLRTGFHMPPVPTCRRMGCGPKHRGGVFRTGPVTHARQDDKTVSSRKTRHVARLGCCDGLRRPNDATPRGIATDKIHKRVWEKQTFILFLYSNSPDRWAEHLRSLVLQDRPDA